MQRKKRQSGLELLRILIMLQIIFLHFCDKGGYAIVATKMHGIDKIIYYGAWYLSRCPVYVFFILTGYFLIKKELSYEDIKNRIKKVYIPMIFFSILIPVLGVALGMFSLDSVNIPKTFFPFLSKTWYFLTGYIVVIVLSPFLNNMVKNLNKKQYRTLIQILIFIFCIWAPLSHLKPFSSFISTDLVIVNQAGKSLYDYLFMYLLGGYLSLHWRDKNRLEFKYLFMYVFLGIVQCTLIRYFPGYKGVSGYNDNLFAVIQSICLVLFFRDFKFKSSIINYISGYTLAIYIIHEHYLFRTYLWNNIFHVNKLSFYHGLYPLKIIGVCVIIFIGCALVEFMRRLLFRLLSKLFKSFKKKKDNALLDKGINGEKMDTKNYRITILITSYNSKKYLQKCVDSLMNQTCDKGLIEIIIVDDGSSDGSELLCDELANKYENVTAVHQPNSGGPSLGRNKGIDLAKSEYIFFHDVDDYMGEDAIRRIIEHIDEWHPDIMLLKMASENRGVPKSMFKENCEFASPYNDKIIRTIGPWKLYRVEFLRKNKIYFKENIAMEDAVFNFEAFFKAKKISVASDYDYYWFNYRDDGSNLTLLSMNSDISYASAENRLKALRLLKEKIEEYVDKSQDLSEIKFKLNEFIYNNVTGFLIRGCSKEQFDELYNLTKDWYDEEQLKNHKLNYYILVYSFMRNHNLKDMRDLYKNISENNLEVKKNDNKIFVRIPVKQEKYLDISKYYRSKIMASLQKVEFYDDKKIKIKFNVKSVLGGVKNIDIRLVPNKDFDRMISFKGKIIKKIKNSVNEALDYMGDLEELMDEYEVETTIDLRNLNKLDDKEVAWTFHVFLDNDRRKRLNNNCKKFYQKAFVLDNDILVPDVHNGNFICYRKISKGYKNENKYIKYKKRILENRIIFSSLLTQPFEVTKNIVKDIEAGKLHVTYSLLKNKIIYDNNGKKVKIPNEIRIYKNRLLIKWENFKNKHFEK